MSALPQIDGQPIAMAAEQYARNGVPVFPCNPNNKRPYVSSGFKDASTDLQTVRQWWTRWPNAMIGMPTGSATKAWVLDVDDPKAFERDCPFDLSGARRCETGKGYHLHFACSGEPEVRNVQRHPKGPEWPIDGLPGAEVRGEGGYVILPPSRHPEGRFYAWSKDCDPTPAPNRLLQMVTASRAKVANDAPNSVASVQADHPYCLAALDSECGAIQAAGNGAQEAAPNDAALKVGHYVGGKVLTWDTARSRLIAAGLSMPSHNCRDPWTVENVTAKVERALRDGMNQPKGVPERAIERATYDPQTGEVLEEVPPRNVVPVDLWQHYAAPELPEGLLPEAIEAFARSHARTMGVDPAGLAMACVCVCGSAISDEIQLQVKQYDPTWRESARLWVGLGWLAHPR